jgi:hypothetical protein
MAGSEAGHDERVGGPAARLCSRRSSLEMVHWTISFAYGEPLLTHLRKFGTLVKPV